jgi:hypothetical protein
MTSTCVKPGILGARFRAVLTHSPLRVDCFPPKLKLTLSTTARGAGERRRHLRVARARGVVQRRPERFVDGVHLQVKSRTHGTQKLTGLTSLCTNPVSISGVPIQTVP